MIILAIDPGTQCGYAACVDGDKNTLFSGVWDLKPNRHEGGGMRYLRLRKYLEQTIDAQAPARVFYEEVRGHKGTDAAQIYGGIVGVISSVCEERAVPYQGVPVGTIKKHATGKGNSNKAAMVAAAQAAFGSGVTDDNEADALWLLDYAIRTLL